jgi:hypothetical protein
MCGPSLAAFFLFGSTLETLHGLALDPQAREKLAMDCYGDGPPKLVGHMSDCACTILDQERCATKGYGM